MATHYHQYHLNNNYFQHPLECGDLLLIQLGRCYCNADFKMEGAHEDFFELTIVNSGKGTLITDDTEVKVSRGDIHLAGPWEHHGIVSDHAEPLKYDFFAFRTKNKAHHERLSQILQSHPTATERIFQSENVVSLVANAIWELHNEEYCSKELIQHMFEQILIYIIRAFQPKVKKHTRSVETVDSEILCYQIMHYIDTHVYSIKRLSEIAEALSYNYSYLSNLFRVTTGRSIMDYFYEKRLEAAKVMILEQKMSITKVADKLNYPSLYSFSRMFKNRYGCSPDAFRRNNGVIPPSANGKDQTAISSAQEEVPKS